MYCASYRRTPKDEFMTKCKLQTERSRSLDAVTMRPQEAALRSVQPSVCNLSTVSGMGQIKKQSAGEMEGMFIDDE